MNQSVICKNVAFVVIPLINRVGINSAVAILTLEAIIRNPNLCV
jgi:hypothetical protein